jgi:hypothetical protein
LSPEQLNDLDALLQKRTGMTVKQVDKFSLMTVMSLMTMKSLGVLILKFMKWNLLQWPKILKKCYGFETLQHKWISYKAYSDAEMITMLQESNDDSTKKVSSKLHSGKPPELYKDITAQR